MAVIGQTLTSPESGWKRYDHSDVNIEYLLETQVQSLSGAYLGSLNQTESGVFGEFYRFNFTGSKIRIISRTNTTYSDSILVKIDGEEIGRYSLKSSNVYQALVFEKLDLPEGEHSLQVFKETTGSANLDAVDIDIDGEIKPYKEIVINKKMILKNLSTNQYYSLAEKKLILLPDSSPETMINYGIEAGKEIRLDETFDKQIIVDVKPVVTRDEEYIYKTSFSKFLKLEKGEL